MKIHTLKPIRHDRIGNIKAGQVVEMPEPWASRYIAMGAAESYQTKVIREVPLAGAGAELPSSSSPVAPVSPETTSSTSEDGEKPKRRGRPRKASS